MDEALAFGWIDAVRHRIDDEAYRIRFGLDQPLYIQYGKYMWNTVRFDFGQSLAA